MECLENIIGLSRTVCECIEDESQYNESLSGLYADELEGLNILTIDKARDCGTGSLWELMDQARTNATTDYITDVMASLTANQNIAMRTFTGQIGKKRWGNTPKTTNSSLSGITLIPYLARKGTVTLSKLYLAMQTAGTYTCYIYSSEQNNDEEALYTFDVVCNGTAWGESESLAIELPMSTEDGEQIYYYVVAENNGSRILNNSLACCGFAPNCKVFGKENKPERIWYNYMKVGGVVANDLEGLAACKPVDNSMNGMRIDVTIACDAKDVLCDNMDFSGGGIAPVQAKAIQYKTGWYIITRILSSTTINRYTMMDREEMFAKKAAYQMEYEKRIGYLGVNMNMTLNGCWSCNQRMSMARL